MIFFRKREKKVKGSTIQAQKDVKEVPPKDHGGTVHHEDGIDNDVEMSGAAATAASKDSDTNALVALYASTDGDNWSEQQSWLDANEDVDYWKGVLVRHGRVTRLTLPGNLMSGTLSEISGLTALTHLILAGNELSGSLDALEQLSCLKHVDLRSNQLGGTIPISLLMLRCPKHRAKGGKLEHKFNPGSVTMPVTNGTLLLNDNSPGFHLPLTFASALRAYDASHGSSSVESSGVLHGLDLSYLSLQGKLPDGLFEFLVSLLNFKLGGNPRLDISNLPEFLASEFEDLRTLKELTGMALGLRGRLGALAFVPSLTEVSLANNRFEGGLDAVAVLTRLVSLDLSANAVGGTLEPLAELGQTLQELRMRDNHIRGDVNPLGRLTNLRVLDLFGNMLEGPLDTLAALEQLELLRLDQNKFVGTLDAFEGMGLLQELTLESNQLEGTLTPLHGLRGLRYLWIGHNRLVGDLAPIAGLVKLEDLSAPGNELSGSLGVLHALSKLESIDLRNNGFEGPLGNLLDLEKLTYVKLAGNRLLERSEMDLLARRGKLTEKATRSPAQWREAAAGAEGGSEVEGSAEEKGDVAGDVDVDLYLDVNFRAAADKNAASADADSAHGDWRSAEHSEHSA